MPARSAAVCVSGCVGSGALRSLAPARAHARVSREPSFRPAGGRRDRRIQARDSPARRRDEHGSTPRAGLPHHRPCPAGLEAVGRPYPDAGRDRRDQHGAGKSPAGAARDPESSRPSASRCGGAPCRPRRRLCGWWCRAHGGTQKQPPAVASSACRPADPLGRSATTASADPARHSPTGVAGDHRRRRTVHRLICEDAGSGRSRMDRRLTRRWRQRDRRRASSVLEDEQQLRPGTARAKES